VTLLIEPDARKRVEAAVTAARAKVLPIQIDRDGVFIRTVGEGAPNA
jgi:hypothetical protein